MKPLLAAFAEEGILVSNTPDVLNSGVADMGMALILASARNVVSGESRKQNISGVQHWSTQIEGINFVSVLTLASASNSR